MKENMTAKEKQIVFIKTFLKPTLKYYGYLGSGQTWWKDKGDFFNVINLQNYSWNSKHSIDFRFSIGIALKATLKDEKKKKVTHFDMNIHLDEGSFIQDRINRKFGNNQGYTIRENTNLNDFISALKVDFEQFILPKLDEPETLQDCIVHYGNIPFWGEHLKKQISCIN